MTERHNPEGWCFLERFRCGACGLVTEHFNSPLLANPVYRAGIEAGLGRCDACRQVDDWMADHSGVFPTASA